MSEPKTYRIRWHGKELGRFTQKQILRKVKSGEISKLHQISSDGQRWETLSRQKIFSLSNRSTIQKTAVVASPKNHKAENARRKDTEQDGGELECSASENTLGNGGQVEKRIDHPFTPIIDLFRSGILKKPAFIWVLIFGTLPFVINTVHYDLKWNFARTIWLLEGYFCFFWAVCFFNLIKPESGIWKKGFLYALFTAFIGIPILLIWQHVPYVQMFYSGVTSQNPLFILVGFILGVGVFEEMCKSTPLLLFGTRKKGIKTVKEGTFLGVMSGLGFSLNEGVNYSIRYGFQSTNATISSLVKSLENSVDLTGSIDRQHLLKELEIAFSPLFENYGNTLLLQIMRLLILPLMHASWAGILGYFIALAYLRNQWGVMFSGLFLVATLHGLYNYFAGSPIGIIAAFISILMILSCIRFVNKQSATENNI